MQLFVSISVRSVLDIATSNMYAYEFQTVFRGILLQVVDYITVPTEPRDHEWLCYT